VTTDLRKSVTVWRQIEGHLEPAMDHLTAGFREIILLRFYRHLVPVEIGRRLAISDDEATRCVRQALEALCRELAKRGVHAETRHVEDALLHFAVQPVPARAKVKLSFQTVLAAKNRSKNYGTFGMDLPSKL